MFVWGVPAFQKFVAGGDPKQPNFLAGWSQVSIEVPNLHGHIYRTAPVAPVAEGSDRAATAEKAIYDFKWLGTTGTGIF